MPDEYSDPGKLVLTLFDKLIDNIKSTRPIKTDGSQLQTGFVYSQLVLGMPCDPLDYMNAWAPAAGGTIQDVKPAAPAATTGQPAAAGQPASGQPAATGQPASGQPGAAGSAPPGIDPKLQRAINAAWKTSKLVDNMIMVTNDDAYLEYPTARHISFAYQGIVSGMQSLPMPPISPDIQKQIDDAKKVLYDLDPSDGSILGKSDLYKRYEKNAMAYARAKTDFANAQTAALANPTTAASWPMTSAVYQQAVDDAYDTLKTEGAEKVERAIDIIGSVGVSMQDAMIKKARQLFDVWNMSGLSGVADQTPYAYVSPTGWADPDNDDEGWQTLTVTQSDYQSHSEFHSQRLVDGHFQSDSSSSSGGGGVAIFGFGGYGGGGSTSTSWSNHFQTQDGSQYQFHNDAKNLSISITYGLCTINRPWLVGDLFYLRNWYLVGNPKNAVSDGTIDGQVKNEKPLMPMIPVQFLVIRDVRISATAADWGGDGQTLRQMYSDSQAQGSSWNAGGGGGFSCGFLTIGGEGSHSESHATSSFSSRDYTDSSSNYGWSFDGETLEIKGAQIIAWLSEVVPSAAPLPDPGLKS